MLSDVQKEEARRMAAASRRTAARIGCALVILFALVFCGLVLLALRFTG